MHQHVEDYWRNRHGFPQGYHFMPKPPELIDLLADKLAGRPLPRPLCSIFHDVRIRGFNPDDLYETYQEHKEAGYIYFFSEREFAKPGGSKKRPTRRTAKGGWKASGGAKAVTNGGVDVGQKLTMVFYEERFPSDKYPAKTDWGMHEFTKIIGPDNKLADMAIYRLYKMRSGKEKKKASQGVATTIPGAGKPTVMALPAPRQPAGRTFRANNVVWTSQVQARAQVGPHYYHGNTYGVAVAPAPPPSRWVMPAAARPPVQLHGAGRASYTGLIVSPALSMASRAATAANYTSMSRQQQQQAAGQLEYASPGDWCMPSQMPLPPPTAPVPLMAPVPEPAAHCSPQQQQQAGEQLGYPELADCNEQLLKIDLPPPLPPPAPAVGEYMVDEFSAWYKMQQVSSPVGDPWFPMTEEESQLCTFTMDELLGPMDDGAAPATMVAEESDANNQVQNSNQQEPLVAAN